MMKYKKILVSLMVLITSACGDNRLLIKIKGSDTEVNLVSTLAEKFHPGHPQYSIAVSGGGSGLGIAALLNGQADIANSSRPLTPAERRLFKAKHMRLIEIVFAEDATAFIVNRQQPIDTITVSDLCTLLNTPSANWRLLTDTNLPVTIYGRQSNSGTHTFIKNKLGINFSSKTIEMNGNAQIIQGIKQDHSGIGYVSAGYLKNNDSQIKALRVSPAKGKPAVSPLEEKAILENKYFFQRPLYQFIRADSWPKVRAFIEFEKSGPGKAVIKASGYYFPPKAVAHTQL